MTDTMGTTKSMVMAVTKPGCPACEQTKPSILKASKNVQQKRVRFQEVNADTQPQIVNQLNVQAFPEFIYKNRQGQVHKMPWTGIPTPSQIVSWVDAVAKRQRPKPRSNSNKNTRAQCSKCSAGSNGPGVDPKIWGPPLWFVIHTVALSYPRRPSPRQKTQMKRFFQELKDHLPCHYCQKHFAKELESVPASVFASRDSLFEWTVKFHDKVSDRTHNPQPRHSVAYWRQYYKNHVYAIVRRDQHARH